MTLAKRISLHTILALACIACHSASAQVETKKLTASDGAADDQFGESVAIRGDVAAVGAWGDGDGAGSVYIYRNSGSDWVQEQKLTRGFGEFGSSVSLNGGVLVVGASGASQRGQSAGAAYVYRHDGNEWLLEEDLAPSDPTPGDNFGNDVDVDGDVAVVGAVQDGGTSSGLTGMGKAYVFRRGASGWVEEQKLVASDAGLDNFFGNSLSITRNVVVVGSPGNDSATGAAYVFRYDGSSWVMEKKLVASDAQGGSDFGNAVSISGDIIAVGAWRDSAVFVASGSVYLFRYDGTDWLEEAKLVASDATRHGEQYARSVSVRGDTIIVGAAGHRHTDTLGVAGATYVYSRNAVTWSEQTELLASDGDHRDGFGGSVDFDGKHVIIGANGDDDQGNSSGSAYIFDMTSATAIELGGTVPTSVILSQNYPNPFNPSTKIHFRLPLSGQIRIVVSDVLGREVDCLLEGHFPPGEHDVTWEAGHLPSGVYLYRLSTEHGVESRSALLLR